MRATICLRDLRRCLWLVLALAVAPAGTFAADASGDVDAFFARYREASVSAGFMIRLEVVQRAPTGETLRRAKLAVIGQRTAGQTLLLWRALDGLAPDSERYLLHASADGQARLYTLPAKGETRVQADQAVQVDADTRLWGLDLFALDWLASWADWPHQRLAGGDADPTDCARVVARPATGTGPQVTLCIAHDQAGIRWMDVSDGRGQRLRHVRTVRTASVQGLRFARQFEIETAATRTMIRIYSADREFDIPPGTFGSLGEVR